MSNPRKNIRTLIWIGWPLLVIGGLLLFRSISGKGGAGEKLYQRHCENCHMAEGEGLKQLIPPLKGSTYFEQNRTAMACLIRKGISGPIVVGGIEYNQPMPGNEILTPSEMTILINFLRKKWYQQVPAVTFAEIDSVLSSCP
ncbi:MAG: cytochrome c [Bacteroidia bacterium]